MLGIQRGSDSILKIKVKESKCGFIRKKIRTVIEGTNDLRQYAVNKYPDVYLGIKRKFEIVKYNKNIQNILHIEFIDYKIISGKYIIFYRDGKGKEYELKYNELIFEGEYLPL